MTEFFYNFFGKNIRYTMPDCYNELSRRQLIRISNLFYLDLSAKQQRIEALRILLNKSRYRFKYVPADAKARLLEYTEWVFNSNTLTEQLIPKFRGYYGPASDWDNLTGDEWHACELFYPLIAAGDDTAIDKLIAVLYRKGRFWYSKKKDRAGDIRKAYNANLIAYRAKKIARWPAGVKRAIVTWFDGCRESFIQSYDVFEQGTPDQEKNAAGMFEIMRGLSGERYGTYDQVLKLNVHLIGRELEIIKKEVAKNKI